MMLLAVIALGLLLAPVLIDVMFNPAVRRLSIRNVLRRKGEAMLVIGGSLLATALITASLVVGDSFGQSVRDLAKNYWGPVDELVIVEDGSQLGSIKASVDATDSAIDGVMAMRYGDASIGTVGPDRRVEPLARFVEADLGALGTFGGDPAATGFESLIRTPLLTEVVLNDRLAGDLQVEPGDDVDLFLEGQRVRFRVSEVVEATGFAGFADIVAMPGAITDRLRSEEGVTNAIAVSNTGGVFDGAEQTDAVVSAMESALGSTIEIQPVKADLLRDADLQTEEMTTLFGTIGGFSVAAGVLLVINLFVMLASERKSELGVMRALGVRRSQVWRSFVLEGALYGIVAAGLGMLAGIGVASAVVVFAGRNFNEGVFAVSLSVAPTRLLTGALIGLAISQVTVVLTSIRTTRLNIVRALKDLPEPRGISHRRRNVVVGLVGLLVGVGLYASAGTQPAVAMTAPVLVMASAIPLASLVLPKRLVTLALGSAALAWPAAVFGLLPEVMADPDISLFLLQGLLLVGLATVVVTAMAPFWTWLANVLSRGGISSRLGLAHAVDRPVRTALLVAMYSIVIFTVTFMAIINSVFQASAPTMALQSGGSYDLMVTTNPTAGLRPAELADVGGVQRVVAIGTSDVSVPPVVGAVDKGDGELTRNVSLVGADFLETAPPTLLERSDHFVDDAQAWAAVADSVPDDDLWVIMPEYSGHKPGDEITMVGRNGSAHRAQVAGVSNLTWLIATDIYAPAHLADDLGDTGVPTRFFLTVDDGVDVNGISHDLESAFADRGVVARSFLASAKVELDGQQAFLQMLQGYLGVGLLIGIAGLGVVLARAVRERRRQIAMMRAMGFPGHVMRRAFLIEAGFIGLQGVCLGVGLGLVTGWQTLTRSGAFEEDLTFDAPVMWMVGFGAACLAASMLAAIIPAMRAGRISPAAALRLAN